MTGDPRDLCHVFVPELVLRSTPSTRPNACSWTFASTRTRAVNDHAGARQRLLTKSVAEHIPEWEHCNVVSLLLRQASLPRALATEAGDWSWRPNCGRLLLDLAPSDPEWGRQDARCNRQRIIPLLADRDAFALAVMAGPDPAISVHWHRCAAEIDGRVRPGHDGRAIDEVRVSELWY